VRFRILIVVIGAGCLWSLLTAVPVTDPEEEAEGPETPTFRPAKADESGSRSKLDPSRLWREEASDEPLPPDPLVHCRPGGDAPDTYLRSSECKRRGGEALEEPSWAKTD
jgi:hypothetical protein